MEAGVVQDNDSGFVLRILPDSNKPNTGLPSTGCSPSKPPVQSPGGTIKVKATMTWIIAVAYYIVDDLLEAIGHRDDPRAKPQPADLLSWVETAFGIIGNNLG